MPRDALALADQAQEQVLRGDVLVRKATGFLGGMLQDALRAGVERERATGHLGAAGEGAGATAIAELLDRLPDPAPDRGVSLTRRQREVLQLVAKGKANKETAWELGISIKTVEKHRQHVMDILGIHDTAGLTRYAMSSGVIENSGQLTMA